jgi:hypothetical protein
MARLPRKAAGSGKMQSRREDLWAANSKTERVQLPKSCGAHIVTPCARGAGHGATGFSVCLTGLVLL